MFPLLAMVVTTVVSGMLIEMPLCGCTLFFTSMGLIVVVCGLVGGMLMKEAKFPHEKTEGISFWKQVTSGFSIRTFKEKPTAVLALFLLLFAIAEQICMPYQIIYYNSKRWA